MLIRLSGIVYDSVANGEGIRTTIFTQGCLHNCKGCQNDHTHSLTDGVLKDIDDLVKDIDSKIIIRNITISGGEPFIQPNQLNYLLSKFKELNYNVWVYTGFTIEEIKNNGLDYILDKIDVLVDGKFDENLMSPDTKYIGSSNQHIIRITNN